MNVSLAEAPFFSYNQAMEKEKDLSKIFKNYPAVKLVYLFGSRARDDAGPLSDYDFAVYADIRDKKQLFDLKASLQQELSRRFKTDKVDIAVLNLIEPPELKYNAIKEGKLIYEVEPFRVMVEPRILNEYFDFHYGLAKYGLTQARKK